MSPIAPDAVAPSPHKAALAVPAAVLSPVPASEALPRHVAIIMDGNGRWARARGWERTRGHLEGAESVRAITRECARLGIEALTLFAFSTENWRRPRLEVRFLMRLLERYLAREREEILMNGIRLRSIGETEALPARVRRKLSETIALSKDQRGLTLTLALNYGGRREIVRAVRRIARAVKSGELDPESIDAGLIAENLDTAGLPDPDLVIRTSGEMRLSGFLLWQLEYSEFWVTPKPWPEFREADLHAALRAYAARGRRRGGL
jgi:undecaprenyl diphosphate synthase